MHEIIKWMIHLKKQIAVGAQALTHERKINSAGRAGTHTTPVELITTPRLLIPNHTNTQKQLVRVVSWNTTKTDMVEKQIKTT